MNGHTIQLNEAQLTALREAPDGQRIRFQGTLYVKQGGTLRPLPPDAVASPVPSPTPNAPPAPIPSALLPSGAAPPAGPNLMRRVGTTIMGTTPTEQAITGGMLAGDALRVLAPTNPLLLAGATILPTAAGAVAGYREHPDSPKLGALKGGAEGLAASIIPETVARVGTRYLRRFLDLRHLVSVVDTHLPALRPALSRGVASLDALFRGGRAQRLAGTALDATKDRVETVVGQRRFPFSGFMEPGGQVKIGKKFQAKIAAPPELLTFREADRRITLLNRGGYKAAGDKAARAAAATEREQAHAATQELIGHITAVDPALGAQYAADRMQMDHALLLQRIFSKAGVISGRVRMDRLGKIVETGWVRQKLESSQMGRDFLAAVTRGAPPILTDMPGQLGFRVWGHAGGTPGLSIHPQFARHVGAVPPVPRTPFALPPRWLIDSFFNPPKSGGP